MAVQQNKRSPARRGNRRSHDRLTPVCLACEPTTGERHRRHHIAPSGTYRGRKVLMTKLEKRRMKNDPAKTTSQLSQLR